MNGFLTAWICYHLQEQALLGLSHQNRKDTGCRIDLLKFEMQEASEAWMPGWSTSYDLDVRYYCMYRVACAQILFEIWTERTGNFSTYRGARERPQESGLSDTRTGSVILAA
jgi:hypothetical protein